jgi:probable rRNA maturation factor
MTKYFVDVYLEDLYFQPKNQKPPISEATWQSWVETWLNYLENDLEPLRKYEFSLILTDDQDIQQFNHQFRHQNKATDVLAFAALEADFPLPDSIDSIPLGDVIISVETAQRQATTQQHSLTFELAWLAVHGFLHLLGWNHPDQESLAKMLETQKLLLKQISVIT